jgi:hypothetical protein
VRYGHLNLSTPGISCLRRCCSLAATRGWPLVLASRSTCQGISLPTLPTSVNGAHLAAEHPPQGSGRVQMMLKWSPTINGVSIAYGLRPRLRPDYPAAECPCGGTLRLSVGGVLAPRIVTHTDIRTCGRSTGGLPPPLRRPRNAPLPRGPKTPSCASVLILAPVDCRCIRTKPVSCYALFEGWLLLSQPPGCLRLYTPLPTQIRLWDLSGRSGLLPSRR